jgi:predicted nucleic-acid-binding protein
MTGIDTNILVRFFAKDDLDQFARARDRMRTFNPGHPGFVSLISLIELEWVLRSRYGMTKVQVIQHMEQLLDASELIVESHMAVTQALHRFTAGKADFADFLIERCSHLAGCRETITFDEDASKFAGMRLI